MCFPVRGTHIIRDKCFPCKKTPITRPVFHLFFWQYRPRKCVLGYSRTKKRLSQLKKQKGQKIKKLRFFQRGQYVVQVQNWPYFQHIFLGDKGQENVLYDILERKNNFLGYKNNRFYKAKNGHFSKGVSPWFWLKNGHYPNFFVFRQYKPAKCVLSYSRTKKRLSWLKTQEVYKIKKLRFFQRGQLVRGLGPKLAIFPTNFFRR